jgi:hypothetical protein
MIEALKNAYGKHEMISIENADKLERILSQVKDVDLVFIRDAGIKWVSYKAGLILASKAGRRTEYAINFLANKLSLPILAAQLEKAVA